MTSLTLHNRRWQGIYLSSKSLSGDGRIWVFWIVIASHLSIVVTLQSLGCICDNGVLLFLSIRVGPFLEFLFYPFQIAG